MKKILVPVCFLLIAVAGCTNQPTGNRDTVANANQPAETKPASAMPSESDIIAKEKATWDAVKKKDWDAFGAMLASDYVEVLDSGVHEKAAALTGVKDFDLSEVTYADWKMIPIDKDAAIVTYSATVKAKYKGQDVPPGPYREASAWVNRNGQWLAVYYQETAAVKEPQAPPPAEKKAASATPNSATKPAETSSDPIANDKIVWDLFRSRNYDAFAALLAPEFMEVEPFGVYDKAGSVKGVQTFDAADATLSDWKSVKFDDDAAMSIYTIDWKGPQAGKEYHASVWANRNGKWLALLHHGTRAAKTK